MVFRLTVDGVEPVPPKNHQIQAHGDGGIAAPKTLRALCGSARNTAVPFSARSAPKKSVPLVFIRVHSWLNGFPAASGWGGTRPSKNRPIQAYGDGHRRSKNPPRSQRLGERHACSIPRAKRPQKSVPLVFIRVHSWLNGFPVPARSAPSDF